jgi:hypothetical protein
MGFSDEHLAISPDPFAGERLSIEIAARELPGSRFASASEAAAAFMSAPTVTLSGTVSGAPANEWQAFAIRPTGG